MNEDIFNRKIKDALKEKAPDGFTDNLMSKLIAEQQVQEGFTPERAVGKGFLFILFGLFGFVLVYTLFVASPATSGEFFFKNIGRFTPQIHFQIGTSVKLLVFSIAAISGFLIVDYFFRTRKMIQY